MKKNYFFGSLTRLQFTSEDLSGPPDFSPQQQGSNIDQSDQSSNGGKGSNATRGMGATKERWEESGRDDENKTREDKRDEATSGPLDQKLKYEAGIERTLVLGDAGYDTGGGGFKWD